MKKLHNIIVNYIIKTRNEEIVMNEIILNLGRNSKYIILFIIFYWDLLINLSLYVHHIVLV